MGKNYVKSEKRCETCFSALVWKLQSDKLGSRIYCLSCKTLFFIPFQFATPDHEEDFKPQNYLDALNLENETFEYHEILKTLTKLSHETQNPRTLHDIGCGTGHFLGVAQEYGFKTTGNDIWNEMVLLSRRFQNDIYHGPFNPKKHVNLNAITLLCVIAHMESPWETVKASRNSLDSAGILYLHTPCKCLIDYVAFFSYIFTGRKFSRILIRRINVSHRRIYSKKAIKIELTNAGFEVIKMEKKRAYGLRYSEYLKSVGVPLPVALKMEKLIKVSRIELLFPKNRWSIYCKKGIN